MSDRAFEWKVNVIRDANKIRKELTMDTELWTGKEWHEAVEGESESREDRKGKEVGEINNIFQATLASQDEFPLKNSFILDSGSSLHVSHNLKRFHDFQRVPLGHHAVCGSGSITIQGYGEV